jgi:hypothetical protein
MTLQRIEDNAKCDATPFCRVERVDYDVVGSA